MNAYHNGVKYFLKAKCCFIGSWILFPSHEWDIKKISSHFNLIFQQLHCISIGFVIMRKKTRLDKKTKCNLKRQEFYVCFFFLIYFVCVFMDQLWLSSDRFVSHNKMFLHLYVLISRMYVWYNFSYHKWHDIME